jgi:hypothetical protein
VRDERLCGSRSRPLMTSVHVLNGMWEVVCVYPPHLLNVSVGEEWRGGGSGLEVLAEVRRQLQARVLAFHVHAQRLEHEVPRSRHRAAMRSTHATTTRRTDEVILFDVMMTRETRTPRPIP